MARQAIDRPAGVRIGRRDGGADHLLHRAAADDQLMIRAAENGLCGEQERRGDSARHGGPIRHLQCRDQLLGRQTVPDGHEQLERPARQLAAFLVVGQPALDDERQQRVDSLGPQTCVEPAGQAVGAVYVAQLVEQPCEIARIAGGGCGGDARHRTGRQRLATRREELGDQPTALLLDQRLDLDHRPRALPKDVEDRPRRRRHDQPASRMQVDGQPLDPR